MSLYPRRRVGDDDRAEQAGDHAEHEVRAIGPSEVGALGRVLEQERPHRVGGGCKNIGHFDVGRACAFTLYTVMGSMLTRTPRWGRMCALDRLCAFKLRARC